MTATESDWRLEQGDVDSAFLNGRHLDDDRRVYFRAPKGGFRAVPELGWDYIPEGTILKAKKGVYGLNDAPLLWYLEHRDTILSLEGAEKSKLCPALFLFRDPTTKKLLGMTGIHVDDDLILGSKQFFENQVAQLRKMHSYGKWHTSVEGFFHCGRFIQRQADGSLKCGQNEYVESLMPITTIEQGCTGDTK